MDTDQPDAAGIVTFTPGIDLDYELYCAGLEVRVEFYPPFQEAVRQGLTSD